MKFYANPYDTSATGFYFETPEEYDEKAAKSRVEEFEIDFIDGTAEEAALVKVAKVTQGNLHQFFDAMESLKDYQLPALYFLLYNYSYDLADALEKVDELSFREGNAKAWAEGYIDDMGGPSELGKETLERYFDYDSFANDAEQGGDITEFEFGGTTYTAEPNSV